MKKLLIVVFMANSLLAQEKILTLGESLAIGLQNSKDLKNYQSKLKSADAKLTEISSQFLPQFKLLANYTRLSDNIPPFEVTMPFALNPIRISEALLNNYTFKARFQPAAFFRRQIAFAEKIREIELMGIGAGLRQREK